MRCGATIQNVSAQYVLMFLFIYSSLFPSIFSFTLLCAVLFLYFYFIQLTIFLFPVNESIINLSIYLNISLFIYLLVYLRYDFSSFICAFMHLSIWLFLYSLFVYLFICLFIYLIFNKLSTYIRTYISFLMYALNPQFYRMFFILSI